MTRPAKRGKRGQKVHEGPAAELQQLLTPALSNTLKAAAEADVGSPSNFKPRFRRHRPHGRMHSSPPA